MRAPEIKAEIGSVINFYLPRPTVFDLDDTLRRVYTNTLLRLFCYSRRKTMFDKQNGSLVLD
jgi:hypothetical protein